MQVRLDERLRDDADAALATGLLRACVHCGFCNAACPTYRLLGDELDAPRGRLYLIKQVLEGEATTARTRLHLDRCLTCRACETACPSGVEYGTVVDIGRALVDSRQPRSRWARLSRSVLAAALTGPVFRPAVVLGRALRGLLPRRLSDSLLPRVRPSVVPRRTHPRRVLLLEGCVQPALAPNINAATRRVLDALGIEVVDARAAGCCGAIRQHLDAQAAARDDIRRNIDAWWPAIEQGVEAIVVTASGCGPMLRDYARLLRGDSVYADKAARVATLARDVSQVVGPHAARIAQLVSAAGQRSHPTTRVAFQAPCSLQHGLKIRGVVEPLLEAAGAILLPVADGALCCGSAGTYSLLQQDLSRDLRARKREALLAGGPELILSANIGCMSQLADREGPPVRHWIEWLDECLGATGSCDDKSR